MNDDQRHERFSIERVYPNCRAHVWAAWADPDKKRAWFGDGLGETDFREGGRERGRFENEMGEHVKDSVFFEIAPEQRIVYAYSMAMNGTVHTVSLTTVLFEDEGGGTRLTYTEQMCVIPPSDGADGRESGWSALLDGLEAYLARDTANS